MTTSAKPGKKTIGGFLPPNSSVKRANSSNAFTPTCRPTAVESVKLILSIPGCLDFHAYSTWFGCVVGRRGRAGKCRPGEGECFVQRFGIADMVGQDQHKPGIE